MRVIVELSFDPSTLKLLETSENSIAVDSFIHDKSFKPVSIGSFSGSPHEADIFIIRGSIDPSRLDDLKRAPGVAAAYLDGKLSLFSSPVDYCACNYARPGGSIRDVATLMEIDKLWSAGYKGSGIVIGIVDGGLTANGRNIATNETPDQLINNVIAGWPIDDWGTTAGWGQHGNQTASNILGIAPEAKLYDIRLSPTLFVSDAISGYLWALSQFRKDGTPHVLVNCWGIYQKHIDPAYATDPSHRLTQLVAEAIKSGMLVIFAAGNCGSACPNPDGQCGNDLGPHKDIWGANGHPNVMTVAAVTLKGKYIGQSSAGPAALNSRKPDFCAYSLFTDYGNRICSGTSAACAVTAGAVALLKQTCPRLTQEQMKTLLAETASDLWQTGWNQYTGYGIIRPGAALNRLRSQRSQCSQVLNNH